MPALKFTELAVQKLKLPKGKVQVSYFDTLERGLALVLVVGSETKTWRCLRYVKGKAQSFKIGRYPQLKLADARKQARAYHDNPEKLRAQAEVGSFKEIAENWIKRHVDTKGLRSKPEIERILNHYVFPKWGKRPFLEIRRREVNELVDDVADRNGLAQSNAVLAVVRGIMTWYQTRDEDYTSPIVRGMKRNHAKPRERILTDDEIRSVWTACEQAGTFGALVRMCLLTGQRRNKVAAMRWADVVNGVWTIPAEAREKGTAGVLVLPKQALAVIEAQETKPSNPFVFAGKGGVAFNAFSQGKAELDQLLPDEMPAWTLHDLRRTARSAMSRAGVRPDIAERVLGHVIPGVEGVYDRHSYRDEKAEALKVLAAQIDRILDPTAGDNVVPINKGRRPRSARKSN